MSNNRKPFIYKLKKVRAKKGENAGCLYVKQNTIKALIIWSLCIILMLSKFGFDPAMQSPEGYQPLFNLTETLYRYYKDIIERLYRCIVYASSTYRLCFAYASPFSSRLIT